MDSRDLKLRCEVAKLVREYSDEIDARLERLYVEQYPHSRANQMDAAVIHDWALFEIRAIAMALETGEYAGLAYDRMFGDMLIDSHNTQFSPFVNGLSSIYFIARITAPVLFQASMGNPVQASAIIDCFEHFIQEVVDYNCELYMAETGKKRALSRTWDLMGQIDPGDGVVDTPALRYLPVEESSVMPPQANSYDFFEPPVSGEALSRREREVLALIVEGKTNSEIAGCLGISLSTVKNHVAHIFDKYGVNNRASLVGSVLRSNLS